MPRVASGIARGSSSRPVARQRFGDSPRNRSSHGSWPASAGILELTSFVVLDGVTQNRNRKELHVVRTLAATRGCRRDNVLARRAEAVRLVRRARAARNGGLLRLARLALAARDGVRRRARRDERPSTRSRAPDAARGSRDHGGPLERYLRRPPEERILQRRRRQRVPARARER